LNKELGIGSELIGSRGGVFEIEYGGKLVFSKKELGRFPNDGEVLNLIKNG
jgi:selenoprotein W-related protein